MVYLVGVLLLVSFAAGYLRGRFTMRRECAQAADEHSAEVAKGRALMRSFM